MPGSLSATEVGLSTEPPESQEAHGDQRNLSLLSGRALLVGLRANVLTVVLQPFVLYLGQSVAFVGLLESIGGYRGLVPTAIQPLAGWLADRAGRKGIAVLAGIFTVGSLLLLAAAGALRSPALLVPAIVLLGLNGLGRPALDAMVGESAPRNSVGRAYGMVTFTWALAGVFASLGAGYMADRLGYPSVYLLTAGIEVAGTLLLALGVRETLTARRRARLAPHEAGRLVLETFVPPRRLRGFYAAVILDSFFYGLGSALLYGFLADRFGYTPFQFGIMTTAFSISWALFQLPAGRWVDDGRAKQFLIMAEILNAGVIASWLVTSSFLVFTISMLALGLTAALWSPALMAWIYARVAQTTRAEELGRLSAVPGVFAFPAPWLGGLLYQHLGYAVPLLLNLIGTLLAGAVFAWGVREPPSGPEQPPSSLYPPVRPRRGVFWRR